MGASAATTAMAVVHTLASSVPFPPLVVAQSLVRATPGGFATFLIDQLGHWALRVAVAGAAGALLLSGGIVGLAIPWLERRIRTGAAFLAGPVAFVPVWAASVILYPPAPGSVSRAMFAVASLPELAVGGFAAGWAHRRLADEPTVAAGSRAHREQPGADPSRRYLLRSLWWGTAAVLLGVSPLGQLIHRRPDPGTKILSVPVGPPPTSRPAAGDAAFAHVAGLVPDVTPLADFYVVDEEIIDPDIDPAAWRLSVGGLTARPLSLTYDALQRLPLVERFQTLECISNPTGGHLISNGRWVGVPLFAILERAGVRPDVLEVVFWCVGAYLESLSIEQAMDETTLVAIGLNGHVLPRAHGFPARILSVGTYGMKNPKWLESIEVVDRPYQGFWERRGWSKTAVVKWAIRRPSWWATLRAIANAFR